MILVEKGITERSPHTHPPAVVLYGAIQVVNTGNRFLLVSKDKSLVIITWEAGCFLEPIEPGRREKVLCKSPSRARFYVSQLDVQRDSERGPQGGRIFWTRAKDLHAEFF